MPLDFIIRLKSNILKLFGQGRELISPFKFSKDWRITRTKVTNSCQESKSNIMLYVSYPLRVAKPCNFIVLSWLKLPMTFFKKFPRRIRAHISLVPRIWSFLLILCFARLVLYVAKMPGVWMTILMWSHLDPNPSYPCLFPIGDEQILL